MAFLLLAMGCQQQQQEEPVTASNSYEDLVEFFKEWRAFEKPPLRDGAPDYTAATFEERHPEFKNLQAKLLAFDTSGWTIPQKVDWYIVWAEMNGYDFNHRILKPWERDPAFYKSLWMHRSDVPAHEGPTHHMTTEIWTYEFPLIPAERERLLGDLSVIPPLNEQAKLNLTGNAKDLWIAGIRDIRSQSQNLRGIIKRPGVEEDEELVNAILKAISSTDELTVWLEKEASAKTGPSGIGKENYTWYMQCAPRAAHLGRRSDDPEARAGTRLGITETGRASQSRYAPTGAGRFAGGV